MEKSEKVEEFGVENPISIWNLVMVIACVTIFICFGLIGQEIFGARNACKDFGGDYSIQIYPVQHLCDNQNFSKYSIDGWDFEHLHAQPSKISFNISS